MVTEITLNNVAISDARSRSATYHYIILCCATLLQSRCVKTSGTPTTLIYKAAKVKYAVGGRDKHHEVMYVQGTMER